MWENERWKAGEDKFLWRLRRTDVFSLPDPPDALFTGFPLNNIRHAGISSSFFVDGPLSSGIAEGVAT